MSARRYVVPFMVAYVILWCQLISSISMTDVLSSETAYGPQRVPTTSDGGSMLTWHHDCSNLTDFDGRGDDTWPHNSDVSVTFGSITCSGNYFSSADIGTGTGHHGPLYYATLDTPFTLAEFTEVRAEIEIDATSADRRGWIRVGFHAPDNATILTLQVADPGTGVSAAYANAVYRFINGTTPETPQDYPAYFGSEPYHESFAILKNSSGLYSSYPGIPNASLLESSQIESNRIVKYVSIQFNGYDTGALCETMRIHDITLEYLVPEPGTLPITTTTVVLPGIETILIIVIGGGGAVIVIILQVAKKGKG